MITSCVPTVEQDSEEDVNHCYHCDIRNRYRPMRHHITSSNASFQFFDSYY